MTVAHIAGVPVEEWLFPIVAMGGTFAVAVRARWRKTREGG